MHCCSVVIERVLFEELLLDNSTVSAAVEQFTDEWCISLCFRATCAPGSNGIVERNHHTIKRIVARGVISLEEVTFWYSVTPRQEAKAYSVPSRGLFRYAWRVPYDVNLQVKLSVLPTVLSCTKQ